MARRMDKHMEAVTAANYEKQAKLNQIEEKYVQERNEQLKKREEDDEKRKNSHLYNMTNTNKSMIMQHERQKKLERESMDQKNALR